MYTGINMNMEFHYYVNLLVAKLGGFDEMDSHIIAASSQFVDDNSKVRKVYLGDNFYENIITQTVDLRLSKNELKDIYTCFHFQPAEKDWITKPNSPLACDIFTKALSYQNLYMLGIASHAFTDTYAHQNFIGYSDSFNNPIGISGIPNYGHMYYLELPDIIGINWLDIRINKMINNNNRFIQAACNLLSYYCTYNLIKTAEARRRQKKLKELLKPAFMESSNTRIKLYHDIYLEFGGTTIVPYSPQRWQRQIMQYSVKDKLWIGTHNFENSHWHNFQEQVKTYKVLVLRNIDEFFKNNTQLN